MKLFDSIMKNFDNDSLGLLGAVLGEHEVKVRDGVEAAVPEILCAIGSQTKSKEGRGMLWRELRDTDDNVASSFPSQLHYQNSLPLVEKGNQQLSGLVGQDIDAITKRVSHAADIGSSSASKVVGAVSPLIFSSLAAWQKKENVDAEGWQKLFAEQGEGLRERAVHASTRKFDAKTGQRTFPSFDKKITTGQGGGDDKWTSGTGFTPGYTGSAKEKFHASGLTSESPSGNTKPIGKFAAGAAGAAAAAGGLAAASGKVTGAASGKTTGATSGKTTGAASGKTTGATSGKATGAASSATAHSSSFAAKSDSTGGATKTVSATEGQTRWVPDKENLKRERERTAIERARSEREAKLAKENSGGLGWLWWQMVLLAALAGLGWFFRGEISEIINKPTPVASADLNLSDESDSTLQLPSEEAADVVEGLDAQTDEASAVGSTAPQDATSNDQSDDTSASNGVVSNAVVVEGALENATDENGPPQLSSPGLETKTEVDLPATEQSDDTPKLAPMDPSDDTENLGSAVNDPATIAADSTAGASDGKDADLQVETALTSLELSMKDIKDEASAKTALPKMEKSVTTLEGLLETSSTWDDVDKELIDIQLRDAAELFGKLKKSVSSMPNVKGVVTPLFGRLEKLLVSPQVAP